MPKSVITRFSRDGQRCLWRLVKPHGCGDQGCLFDGVGTGRFESRFYGTWNACLNVERGKMPKGGDMKTSIRDFLHDEDGITALEYGILAALVAVILVAVIGKDGNSGLGKILKTLFDSVASAVAST